MNDCITIAGSRSTDHRLGRRVVDHEHRVGLGELAQLELERPVARVDVGVDHPVAERDVGDDLVDADLDGDVGQLGLVLLTDLLGRRHPFVRQEVVHGAAGYPAAVRPGARWSAW